MLVGKHFRNCVNRYGRRPAVRYVADGQVCEWTYAELAGRAAEIANRLTREGLTAGDAVGLLAIRHPDTLAGMLAVLSIGAHYVPVDPANPLQRLNGLCDAAKLSTVIAPAGAAPALPSGIRLLQLAEVAEGALSSDELPAAECSAETPAYIMFTSGSTGPPKGVVVPHRAIERLVVNTNFLELDDKTVFMHLAPLAFDASTLEIWAPLLNGGVCAIYPQDRLPTATHLAAEADRLQVNSMWLTSSLFNNVVDEDPSALRQIRQLLTGGEALSVSHVRRALDALPATEITNGYGPTENTTFTTTYRVPREFAAEAVRIPIGTAISGTDTLIVDQQLQPVAVGEEGELLALGDGLAVGYLDQPELTEERFVRISGVDGCQRRAYRTGDRVRLDVSGNIDFLGRFDDQVKIEGHRIEPGEIERVIQSSLSVTVCRVLALDNQLGQKRLVAYVVADGDQNAAQMRNALANTLPAYMIPHQFVLLEKIPLNSNGKVDLSALPNPFQANGVGSSAQHESSGLQKIREIWIDILGHAPDSDEQNFFDAGGTSLDAMRLHQSLSDAFSRELEPTFVFEMASIHRQQAVLCGHSSEPGPGATTHLSQNRAARRKAALSGRARGRN